MVSIGVLGNVPAWPRTLVLARLNFIPTIAHSRGVIFRDGSQFLGVMAPINVTCSTTFTYHGKGRICESEYGVTTRISESNKTAHEL